MLQYPPLNYFKKVDFLLWFVLYFHVAVSIFYIR